ncbi:MAG: DUF4926 domain-containing protein [Anaerolineaceae bacterium]|nr:MAG: DUF4926 domain-containing protein [Anaerolineaceae bacterium]
MKIHDVVALLEDVPEYGLKRGQVGAIVEEWDAGVYEVEFADTNGVAYAMVALRATQMMLLRWQPAEESA